MVDTDLGLDTDLEHDGQAAEGKSKLGRALDIAGIAAGVVLGVILFDILSGGKVTRWARTRRGPEPPKSGPCEGCGENGPASDD